MFYMRDISLVEITKKKKKFAFWIFIRMKIISFYSMVIFKDLNYYFFFIRTLQIFSFQLVLYANWSSSVEMAVIGHKAFGSSHK